MANKLKVYVEAAKRRTFAGALDWPGWCRMGRDEDSALQALVAYGPRYARALRPARLDFELPEAVSDLDIVERLKGNATTDFGAPDAAPASDAQPLDDQDLKRLQAVLKACWRSFDAAVENAQGKPLRSGPRGGGRSLDMMIEHVLGSELGYLRQLGGKPVRAQPTQPGLELARQSILEALEASARGEIAAYGPRGGKRWSPRFFTRREAWHVLDHAWELEDRLEQPAE